MTEFYGSGRFCSRSCANTRKHTQETKIKISNSIKDYNNNTEFNCPFCNFKAKSHRGLTNHINHCKYNPNKIVHHNQKHKLNNNLVKFRNNIILDITYAELNNYKQSHDRCEICGRTVEEANKYKGKYSSKQLCIDHDHFTNKFRGLLCQQCNRQLGWYENNKEAIDKYLNKT